MLFARTVGVKQWQCGNCGYLNRYRVNGRNGWRVKCRNSRCQRVYIVGEIFYEALPGFKPPPMDVIQPLSFMSEDAYHAGQLVNKIVCYSCSKAIDQEVRGTDSNGDAAL